MRRHQENKSFGAFVFQPILVQSLLVERIHRMRHTHRRKTFTRIGSILDDFGQIYIFFIGPLAKHKIDLLSFAKIVANADAQAGVVVADDLVDVFESIVAPIAALAAQALFSKLRSSSTISRFSMGIFSFCNQ